MQGFNSLVCPLGPLAWAEVCPRILVGLFDILMFLYYCYLWTARVYRRYKIQPFEVTQFRIAQLPIFDIPLWSDPALCGYLISFLLHCNFLLLLHDLCSGGCCLWCSESLRNFSRIPVHSWRYRLPSCLCLFEPHTAYCCNCSASSLWLLAPQSSPFFIIFLFF